jgi:hypothetical protein
MLPPPSKAGMVRLSTVNLYLPSRAVAPYHRSHSIMQKYLPNYWTRAREGERWQCLSMEAIFRKSCPSWHFSHPKLVRYGACYDGLQEALWRFHDIALPNEPGPSSIVFRTSNPDAGDRGNTSKTPEVVIILFAPPTPLRLIHVLVETIFDQACWALDRKRPTNQKFSKAWYTSITARSG